MRTRFHATYRGFGHYKTAPSSTTGLPVNDAISSNPPVSKPTKSLSVNIDPLLLELRELELLLELLDEAGVLDELLL